MCVGRGLSCRKCRILSLRQEWAMKALLPAKFVVSFERRDDGGLRAWSDDVPGFVLSHSDPKAVLEDVKPALEAIISHAYGTPVVVEELARQQMLTQREYVTLAA